MTRTGFPTKTIQKLLVCLVRKVNQKEANLKNDSRLWSLKITISNHHHKQNIKTYRLLMKSSSLLSSLTNKRSQPAAMEALQQASMDSVSCSFSEDLASIWRELCPKISKIPTPALRHPITPPPHGSFLVQHHNQKIAREAMWAVNLICKNGCSDREVTRNHCPRFEARS